MKARASGDRSPLSAPASRTSLAQLDSERRPTKPEVARSSRARGANSKTGLAQVAEQRPPKPKVRGSTPWSGAKHLDVAKRPKASGCKPDGASPRPFESDRRVQASLAQRTRAVGFYPAGRPFESVTRHQFPSPIAQWAERLAVNQEVRGSKPRRGAKLLISRSSVGEHRLDKAEVDGSFPSAGTSFIFSVWRSRQRACFGNTRPQVRDLPPRPTLQRALGCGRSSMAEPWAVNPLVPVRLRPVTPKRIQLQCVANSSGRVPGS